VYPINNDVLRRLEIFLIDVMDHKAVPYNKLDSRPEARQLLMNLKDCMTSNSFDPNVAVEIDNVLNLMK